MTKNHRHSPFARLHEVHVRIRSSKGIEAYDEARAAVDVRLARRNAGKYTTRWSRI
jgi:hypothetical protein